MTARALAAALLAGVAIAALACGGGKETAGPSPGGAPPPTAARGLPSPSPAAPGGGIASQALSQALLAAGMSLPEEQPAQAGIGGELAALLLQEEDLPGYELAGEFSSAVRTQAGAVPAAGRLFLRETGGSVSVVVSTATILSPEAAQQVRAELARGVSGEELQALQQMLPSLQLRALDAGRLGEQAVGLRLEWTDAAGDGAMGPLEMETFLWLRSERLLAIAVMHGPGTGAPLAYGLALLVDQRAAGR